MNDSSLLASQVRSGVFAEIDPADDQKGAGNAAESDALSQLLIGGVRKATLHRRATHVKGASTCPHRVKTPWLYQRVLGET